MALIGTLIDFTPGSTIQSAQVDQNFSDIKSAFNTSAVLTDVAKTITVTHTYSASQTFSAGFTTAAGITVVGNSTITGTLSGLTGLTVASGGASITGNSSITGTLSVSGALTATLDSASQDAITRLGTITSGVWNGTAVGVEYGGTGLATFGAAGAIPYATAATTLAALPIGAANRVLTSSGSAPQWSASLTGLTGVSATTLTGTLATAAQPNVTSVGTLTSLTVSGTVTAGEVISGSGASAGFRFYAAGPRIYATDTFEWKTTGHMHPSADNSKQLGNDSFAWQWVKSYAFTVISDRSKKEDIQPLGAEVMDALRGFEVARYTYRNDNAGPGNAKRRMVGLMSDQVPDWAGGGPQNKEVNLYSLLAIGLAATKLVDQRLSSVEARLAAAGIA